MVTNEWQKQAERLRELARDPNLRAYLLGRLIAESSSAQLADLVQACLVYRERFGAPGNDRREATASALASLRHRVGCTCDACRYARRRPPELPDL